MLFLVPRMPGFTHHERKTFYKPKEKLSHLLTLEIKSAHNLQTPWVVALWAYLRSGSTQSECFNNHWPACTSTYKVFIFVLVLCFFKLQFTIGNNILYCDLVYTVYRLFNQNNILGTMFDLAPCTALFYSTFEIFRAWAVKLISWTTNGSRLIVWKTVPLRMLVDLEKR